MSTPTQPLNAAVTASGALDDRMRFWLAVIVAVGFFGFITFSSIYPSKLPGDTLGTVVGYVSGFLSAVVMFYFGSSSGSKLKTMQGAKE